MTADFNKCIAFVLQMEGGYVNDSSDPGGETNWGISKRAYANVDIKNLSKAGAMDIYKRDYWIPSGADQLSKNLALVQLDTAVNMGVSHAKVLLVKSGNDPFKYLLLRMGEYALQASTHPDRRKLLLGWINRVNSCFQAMENS